MLTVVEVPLALGISPPGVDELDDSDAAAKCDGRGLCSGGGPTPLATGSGGLDGARGRREVNSWDLGLGRDLNPDNDSWAGWVRSPLGSWLALNFFREIS